MKEQKIQIRFFTIADWQKEEAYLKKMHAQGWKFTKISIPCIYHFTKCPPEDVTYQLDYNPEGIAHKQEYVRMFEDCGWEYLQDFAGYSYFRKADAMMQGKEEIFCDDESRLDMMKRVFAGRYFPLLIIVFLVIVPQIYFAISNGGGDAPILIILFSLILLLYIAVSISFIYRYLKLKDSLH